MYSSMVLGGSPAAVTRLGLDRSGYPRILVAPAYRGTRRVPSDRGGEIVRNEAYWARYESVIDQQIRKAEERGDFADLPGKGKPLPGLDGPDDENWWIKSWIRREGVPSEALLPTPLQLRKESERLPETVRDLPTEEAVRAAISDLNRRIAEWVRAPSGPAVPVRPVDADAIVREWRAARPTPPPAPAPTAPEPARPRWWRRRER
jgi:Domain of unknown function (DUF1992)